MRWVKSLRIACALVVLVISVGCSSIRLPEPMPSDRLGFLDRLGDRPSESESSTLFHHSPRGGWVGKLGGHAPHVDDPFDLRWPLQSVQVTSPFGKRGRDFHEGIDLRAKVGTPVFAAQDGMILYANSKIRGYGKMVVIKHDGKVATIYAHNSKILVRRGQVVKKGQKIAISGNTGHSSGPHLHFEIRRGLYAVNPLEVLPKAAHPELMASSR